MLLKYNLQIYVTESYSAIAVVEKLEGFDDFPLAHLSLLVLDQSVVRKTTKAIFLKKVKIIY